MKSTLIELLQIIKTDDEILNLIRRSNPELYKAIMNLQSNETISEEQRKTISDELKRILKGKEEHK